MFENNNHFLEDNIPQTGILHKQGKVWYPQFGSQMSPGEMAEAWLISAWMVN